MLSQQLLTREFVNHILMPQPHITLSIYSLEQGVYVLPKVSDILLIDLILSYRAANCQSLDNQQPRRERRSIKPARITYTCSDTAQRICRIFPKVAKLPDRTNPAILIA